MFFTFFLLFETLMASNVKWGILGLGYISDKLGFAIQQSEYSELAACASRSQAKAEAFALKWGVDGTRSYDSYDKVLDDPMVEAVYIPLPTKLETEWVLKACRKGKHVLADKPFESTQAVRMMLEVCNANHVQFMDATMFMHHDWTNYVAELVNNTNVYSVHSVFNTAGPKSGNIRFNPELEPMGALGDIAWYTVRFNLLASNWELPEKIFCHGLYVEGALMEVAGIMEFHNHVGTFEGAFQTALYQVGRISGSFGNLVVPSFVISPFEGTSAWAINGGWGDFKSDVFDYHEDRIPEKFSEQRQVVKMVETFSKMAAGGDWGNIDRKWGIYTVKTMIVLDACFESTKTKSYVDIDQTYVNDLLEDLYENDLTELKDEL